ncbi:MAG: FAD-dependent oxidoreductase, partial [Halofilum sp. (in: g-proteobacteria)]|nr:FAD-dependent oxidoreductase [Halofilum sp. (in: g-proteobacteria)]
KTEQNQYLRPILEMADRLGIPYEEWDIDQIRERMPGWDLHRYGPAKALDDPEFGEPTGDSIHGAVLFPCGGYVDDPQLSVHNLQRAAEASGAAFRFNSKVTAILREDGRTAGVELEGGERIAAPVVVNVAGPHSSKVNAMAGLAGTMKITTRALRHEVPHVPVGGNYEQTSGIVTSDSDVAAYSRPTAGGSILIGSEDPPCDGLQWVDPDDFDRNISDRGKAQVMRLAQRMPALGVPNSIPGVVDLYDVTEDWIPIYDKTDLPGFYVAIGTSGNQYKNAPVAGALMAELIEYCEGGADHDAEPMPFRMKYTGEEIPVGFFSRNREINPNSSFSVLG